MSAKSSIRFQLMAANILVKQAVILLAGFLLMYAFDRIVLQHVAGELAAAIDHLVEQAGSAGQSDAALALRLDDPRYRIAASGRYWQVSKDGQPLARSPSLGNSALNLPIANGATTVELEGPNGQTLVASVRTSTALPGHVFAAAIDSNILTELRRQFRTFVILALGGIAALLLTSAWIQVNIGLKPAEMMRSSIERIRLGQDRRIGPGFPDELMPLIDETNRLLEAQEAAVQRARSRAGDLAHGLKTPLTAMSMLNEQLRDAGEADIAGEISKQLDTMSRHVYRELTRTRIAASSGLAFSTDLSGVAGRVRHTMERLPNGDNLDWHFEIEAGAPVAMEEDDAIELLANLLDNARKWARTAVSLRIEKSGTGVIAAVEDDGPGVPGNNHVRILKRGIRLDQSVPGTGLGLTIVKDIVEAYGGIIELYEAASGGLGVRLTLPSAGTFPALQPSGLQSEDDPGATRDPRGNEAAAAPAAKKSKSDIIGRSERI